MKNKLLITISGIFAIILFTGCSHKITLKPSLDEIQTMNIDKKLNLNVGYYISNSDRNKEVITPGGGGDRVDYTPYKDVEVAFKTVLSKKFNNVFSLASINDKNFINTNNIKYVFVPKITTNSFSPSMFTWPPTKFTFNLICKATDTKGNVIWSETILSEGYAEFEEFKNNFSLSAQRATEKAFKNLISKLNQPSSFSKHHAKEQESKQKRIVDNFLDKDDFQGLKSYTEQNPNAVYFISNEELRLALTGPKSLKIGDIKKLLQKGRSETIVTALIKRAKTPYKEFTLKEIDILTKMGLSDNIIASMINVTTELLKDLKLKSEQEFFLRQQKKFASENNTQQKVDNQGNPIMETIGKELGKQGAKMMLDSLFR
ncbi:MAG: hypothetical protein U9N59_11490 [Campylobacterota bacterium]|nr:hypothetical protein [Campylobacterota bacterium]